MQAFVLNYFLICFLFILLPGIALHLHQLITLRNSIFQKGNFATTCCEYFIHHCFIYMLLNSGCIVWYFSQRLLSSFVSVSFRRMSKWLSWAFHYWRDGNGLVGWSCVVYLYMSAYFFPSFWGYALYWCHLS